MSEYEQLFVLECKESDALKLVNSTNLTRVLVAQEIEAVSMRVLGVVPKQSMIFSIAPMKSDLIISIRNMLGVQLASSQALNQEASVMCNENEPFFIAFLNNSQQSIVGNTLLATCSVQNRPTVSQTFQNGFQNQIPFSQQLSLQIDEFGRFLYTLNNFELSQGTSLVLCTAQNALLPGSIVITPSESFAGALETTSHPISLDTAVVCTIPVLNSGYFSGTILVNANNAGIISQKVFSMI